MCGTLRCVLVIFLLAVPATVSADGGLRSAGNTDGVLTWRLGELAPGGAARQVVLLVYGDSYEQAATCLEAGRQQFAAPHSSPAQAAERTSEEAPERAWLRGDATDFALEGTGFFRWMWAGRQCLAFADGGQLSQFTYYVHYREGAEERRAGTPHIGQGTPENLRVVEPIRSLSPSKATGAVQTADGKLRIDIHASAGPGRMVAVEFLLTNLHRRPLNDVRLSTYANIESAHTHEDDYSFLDRRTAGLVVVDPLTDLCVLMAGLDPPACGHSGTWNSIDKLQTASGVALDEWPAFEGLSDELLDELARLRVRAQAPSNIYLPYLHDDPHTPKTRTLTPEEAQAARERDWLFQASGKPLGQRALKEIGWAGRLADRLAANAETADLNGELKQLATLEARLKTLAGEGADEAARELYFAVRQVKRRIMLANPVIDFNQLLFIDQPMPRGPVNDIHEAIHRMGITATPGGRLLVLEGLHPGGRIRQLYPDKPGAFWRPDLSFDARRVLFCFKPHDEKSFHLYEMNLDGTGVKQLTDSDYDDVDPFYLPDGHIMFTTTRGNSYVRCGPFIYSYILARCDADGGNVYLISHGGEPDFVPSLMNDGRVIYSRWEYTDKPLWRVQSLWTTNQDGTNTSVFWGNQSVWPDHLSEPRSIPNSHRVMFSGVGHHDWWSGSIGIIDPDRGQNFPDGLTKVTCDLPWPECSIPPEDRAESPRYHASGAYTGYKTAYPLSERDFLVSARGEGGKFRLYLMDVDGNRELIYEGIHHIWHALPIKPRTVPPRQPDRVAWPGTGKHRTAPAPGVFYSADVYQGVPDLPRGTVKYLRVWQMDHKTYSTWGKTWRHSGPAVSVVQEEGIKRILSVVPVEEDGSVYFKTPAGRALHFQLLDQHYRCLQTMRSFTGVMPGEHRGCVGCHELHSTTPPQATGLALRRSPTELSPPPWGTASISYERFAQPVLDTHCGKCHQGDGEGRDELDLTLRPGYNVFKEPYLTLVGSAGWNNPVPDRGQPGYGIAGAIAVESMDPTMNDPAAYGTLRPMTMLSRTSPLIKLCTSGEHYEVKIEGEDLRRLIAWVDACCPFLGEEELRELGDPEFPGIEELPIRPRVATAPVIERP